MSFCLLQHLLRAKIRSMRNDVQKKTRNTLYEMCKKHSILLDICKCSQRGFYLDVDFILCDLI